MPFSAGCFRPERLGPSSCALMNLIIAASQGRWRKRRSKTHPQLATSVRNYLQGTGGPGGEDSPLLIMPVAGREVQAGAPKVVESWGGTKQPGVEGSAISRGSRQPTATTFTIQ